MYRSAGEISFQYHLYTTMKRWVRGGHTARAISSIAFDQKSTFPLPAAAAAALLSAFALCQSITDTNTSLCEAPAPQKADDQGEDDQPHSPDNHHSSLQQWLETKGADVSAVTLQTSQVRFVRVACTVVEYHHHRPVCHAYATASTFVPCTPCTTCVLHRKLYIHTTHVYNLVHTGSRCRSGVVCCTGWYLTLVAPLVAHPLAPCASCMVRMLIDTVYAD